MNVQLLHGDCLDVIPTLPANSVQMVFADLPYGVTECEWDRCIDISVFWKQITRLESKSCPCIFTATNPFASMVISSNRELFRYDLIWQKTRLSGHLNARKMPMRAHELLLIFYSRLPTYNPQMRENLSGRTGVFAAGNPQKTCYGKTKERPTYVLGQPLLPHSIIEVKSPGSERGMHPTQKPVALLEWLIRTYTNEGDTVLDPTMGSGTTGVACLKTGRNFIGIEKDAHYFDVASKRIEEARSQLALAI